MRENLLSVAGRWFSAAIRLALITGLGYIALGYCILMANEVFLYRSLYLCWFAAAVVFFSVALLILLLNRNNFGRFVVTLVLTVIATCIGLCAGDPMSRGDYDHGFGDEQIYEMWSGIIGAVCGYFLSRLILQGRKGAIEPESPGPA